MVWYMWVTEAKHLFRKRLLRLKRNETKMVTRLSSILHTLELEKKRYRVLGISVTNSWEWVNASTKSQYIESEAFSAALSMPLFGSLLG